MEVPVWSSRVVFVAAALGLAAAVCMLPVPASSAQPPSTQVVIPVSGATVTSTQVVLDASASAGVTQVQFELTGGTLNDFRIATARPTIYGWIAVWNSTTVVSGTYTLQSIATFEGTSATSPGISITVENGEASMSFVLPNGAVSGTKAVFDAVGPAGVTSVQFAYSEVGDAYVNFNPGCPATGSVPEYMYICTISAIPTIYGWIAQWNSTEVPNGSYDVWVNCGQCSIDLAPSVLTVANPEATVVVPANGSTVTGGQWLDCVPPTGYSGVQFWIDGLNLSRPQSLGAATPTYYGWLSQYTSESVADGTYSIYCTAGDPSSGANAFSPTVLVNVAN
jgi:hypothetical protein